MQLIECQNRECYFFNPSWLHNCSKISMSKYEECPIYEESWDDEDEAAGQES